MGNGKQPPARRSRANRQREAKRERRSTAWRVVKTAAVIVGGALVVTAGAGVGYAAYLLKGLPTITADTFTNHLSVPSVVYDRNGKVIGRFAADGDRQPITSLQQVSPYLVNAFVAAEDKTFWSNVGVNPMAMVRAVFQDVLGHGIRSGASTITQQTVKLALFPEQERTLKRKVQEIALAIEVNHMLSKQEIMTDYMNWVYMGRMGTQNIYGVKLASEVLFHKDVKDLTLPEAAFLASIPNNPSLFSPYQNKDNTVQREHYVLDQMLQDGMISQDQYDAALKVDVTKEIQPPPKTSTPYPYVMLDNVEPLVVQQLVQSGTFDTEADAEKALSTGGFQIYTTIDLTAQQDVDNVLKDGKLFANTTKWARDANGNIIHGKDGKPLTDLYEAGVTLIDNATGGILAIGGGRQFDDGAYIDHSDIPRQPGSSIKPLLDYGPAIDMHQLTAASPLFDAPVSYPSGDGKVWKPTDDEKNKWYGIVTARFALVHSLNVPAIQVLAQITPQLAGQYLAKMGITPDAKTITGKPTLTAGDLTQLATAIGGMTHGLTVQQITSAYTVFPNQGVWKQSYLISKITDRNGNILYQYEPKMQRVFSPQTAYIMTDILHDVVLHGTAAAIGANFPGYYIAGKTGTTDTRRDGWFIGYTQKYTMGIWMGYDYNEPIERDDVYNLKFTLWNRIMAPLLKQDPPTQPFPQPAGIVSVAVCSKSGQLPTSLCKTDNDVYNELFIQGTEPTSTCKVHVSALYTVYNGKKYLATTNTPPNEIRQGIFLVPPKPLTAGTTTADSAEYVPTQPDPRGGSVLQGPNSGQLTMLAAPQNVQAVLTNGSVQLTWQPVDQAASYTVWRATSPDGPYTNIGGPLTVTSFTDASLPPGAKVVYYEVYAMSQSGVSPPSAPVSVTVGSAGEGGTSGSGTGNSTGHGNSTGSGSGTGNSVGLPDYLWPGEDQYRSRD